MNCVERREADASACRELLSRYRRSQQVSVEIVDPRAEQRIANICRAQAHLDADDSWWMHFGINCAQYRLRRTYVEKSPLRPIVRCNGLWYCHAHERDICDECNHDLVVVNIEMGYKSPDNLPAEYPRLLIENSDWNVVRKIYARWLELQKIIYPGEPGTFGRGIRLPATIVTNRVNKAPAAQIQEILLQHFHRVQGMATSQWYFFANQAKIMLQDYDTFNQAGVLYEEEVADWTSTTDKCFEDLLEINDSVDSIVRVPGNKKKFREAGIHMWELLEGYASCRLTNYGKTVWSTRKTKAHLVNAFGYFLELNTTRSFWRAIEQTANAFVMHLEKYSEPVDGDVVVTGKAKKSLLQCVAHVFWSLRYAQHRMDQQRACQHQIYQQGQFPFYPYVQKALDDDVDIHLIIAKLCKLPMYDFPTVSGLLSKFDEAGTYKYNGQMQMVKAETMAAFDELSTRYRVLELLLSAAGLVAKEDDIKEAVVHFKFEATGQDVTSKLDHVWSLLREGSEKPMAVAAEEKVAAPLTYLQASHNAMNRRFPPPKKPSFYQKLLAAENKFRHEYADSLMLARSALGPGTRVDTFKRLKARYLELYDNPIRQTYEQFEQSMLPWDVATRFQQPGNEVAKKKPSLSAKSRAIADLAECRDVPPTLFMDASLFWTVGNEKATKDVTPVDHEKGKNAGSAIPDAGSGTAAGAKLSTASTSSTTRRPFYRLERADLLTRDVLWRKKKGPLQWSSVVQLLEHLDCNSKSLEGSKTKVVDSLSGRFTVLRRPHPGDECRLDQQDSYKLHIEDWLNLQYSEIVPANDLESP